MSRSRKSSGHNRGTSHYHTTSPEDDQPFILCYPSDDSEEPFPQVLDASIDLTLACRTYHRDPKGDAHWLDYHKDFSFRVRAPIDEERRAFNLPADAIVEVVLTKYGRRYIFSARLRHNYL